MMRNRDQAISVIDRVLSAAHGDEADVLFISTDRNVTRFANSSVHQNMSEESGEIILRVIADGRMGVAATSSLGDTDIRETADLALDMARRSEPLRGFRSLPRDLAPAPELPTHDEATAALRPAEKARKLRAMFDQGGRDEVSFAGSYSTLSASIAAGNSHGVRRWAPLTSSDFVAIAISDDVSGFATRMSRVDADIDPLALGAEATSRALLHKDARTEIDNGPYDVILEPPALAEIFEWMNMIAFSGQSFEEGSSFFVDHIGKAALGSNFTLVDDPTDPLFLPFPFDGEGAVRRRNLLVDAGVIRGPVLDQIMADRLGMDPTGNASTPGSDEHGIALHLSLEAGDRTREQLIESTERGIWVTRFHYLNGLIEPRTAMMTGMTRDGTFLIENGKVTRRLPNLRWTQSMVEAFSNIEGLTSERRITGTWWNLFGGTITPTVKIRGWNVTGVQRK